MTKQVIVIHGGTTFDSNKDYLKYLDSAIIDIERLKPSLDWKHTLQQALGNNYEVLLPRMPNSTNAQYNEWKLWFENIQTVINKEIILIGHSLGGIFLAKYLSSHPIDNSIAALILLAAPYDETPEEPLGSFKLNKPLNKITMQTKNIYIIHSKDDSVVPYTDCLKYQEQLPTANVITFQNKGHFNMPEFPDISSLIKSI